MDRDTILSALDSEIARLQHARTAIAGLSVPKRRGRPPASGSTPKGGPRRRISAAGIARIREAQRKRWAAQKGASKIATKQAVGKKQKKGVGKKDTKKVVGKVAVKRIPPKKERERKPRVPKKGSAGNALSAKSGVVAVPAGS